MEINKHPLTKKGDQMAWRTKVRYKIIEVSERKNKTILFLCFDENFLDDKFQDKDETKIEEWTDEEADRFLNELESNLFEKPCYLKCYPKKSGHITKFIEISKKEGLIDEECEKN